MRRKDGERRVREEEAVELPDAPTGARGRGASGGARRNGYLIISDRMRWISLEDLLGVSVTPLAQFFTFVDEQEQQDTLQK